MVEVGLIAVAARRHGERDPDAAARAAGAAVLYAVAAGLAVSLLGLVVMDDLFRLMTVPPEVARLGHLYLSTWLLGGPLVFGFFAIEATFRAAGDTRTPFLLLAVSVVLSVALDPLLILGVGPFARLGVEGAALASVMVRGGGFLIGILIALRRGLIRLGAPDWHAVPTIFRVGAPLSLTGVLFSLIYMWLTRFTSRFGTPALAALGVGHKVEGIGFIAISGFALSASALVGQNLGARQEQRAREAVRLTITYCLAVTVTTAAVFAAFPAIIALSQVGQTFEIILEGALGGAGYTFWPMVASSSLSALRVPLAAWWSAAFGLAGIWWAISLTSVARGGAMSLVWLSGAWRHRKV